MSDAYNAMDGVIRSHHSNFSVMNSVLSHPIKHEVQLLQLCELVFIPRKKTMLTLINLDMNFLWNSVRKRSLTNWPEGRSDADAA